MSKIDLTSLEWREQVFQGKNKAYGAYKMRSDSDKRHNKAVLIIAIVTVVGFMIPKLIEWVVPEQEEKEEIGPTVLSTFKPAEVKEATIKRVESVEPPQVLKNSIKFTAPVIKDDNQVTDDEELKSQDEVNTAKGIVSIATVVGGDDVNGQDIADVKEVIVQQVEEKTYEVVEQMPSYPGGEGELFKFIKDNLRYPAVAQENNVQGTVVLKFVVTKSGHVGAVEVLRSLDSACDREAIRVVKQIPKWIPGKQNGESVQVWYTIPIKFKLSDN